MHYEQFQDGTVKCIEDEIPFDLPKGWAWARISSFTIINPRSTLNDDLEVSFVPMANISDGYDNQFASDKRVWRKVKTGFTHFAESDIGIAKITPCFENKKSVIFRNLINGYGAGSTELYILRLISKAIIPEYILCFIKSNNFITRGVRTFSGDVGQQRVTKDYIMNYLVSIPPRNEQHQIVSKIQTAFSLISKVDNSNNDLKELIKKTKYCILDLAIRGKLVPQDPNDESASVLLERIRSEKEELIKQGKIKRDKKKSVIFKGEDNSYYEKIGMEEKCRCINEEIPFEIPPSWTWCRLGEIFLHNTGKALNSSDTTGCLMTYITTSNLYWDSFVLNSLKEMRFSENEIEKCTVRKGDLLVCEGGDIGRAAIWKYNEEIRIQNHIHKLRPYTELSISTRFFYYVFYLWKQMDRIGGRGIGLQGFSSKTLHNLLIPLPPYKEQLSIVSKIDYLFSVLKVVEKSLN